MSMNIHKFIERRKLERKGEREMEDNEVDAMSTELADWEDDGTRPEFVQDSFEYDDE